MGCCLKKGESPSCEGPSLILAPVSCMQRTFSGGYGFIMGSVGVGCKPLTASLGTSSQSVSTSLPDA